MKKREQSERAALLGAEGGGLDTVRQLLDGGAGTPTEEPRRASALLTAGVFTLATCSALLCYTIRVLPSVAMQGPGGIAAALNWTNTDKGQGP
jgi:hypothetical protein